MPHWPWPAPIGLTQVPSPCDVFFLPTTFLPYFFFQISSCCWIVAICRRLSLMFAALRLAAAAAVLGQGVHALSQVTATGRFLFTDDGNRFSIKGVAYQTASKSTCCRSRILNVPHFPGNGPTVGAFQAPTTFIDPLANGTACTRDLPFLEQLNVNAIRVYSVDSSLNHDSCNK